MENTAFLMLAVMSEIEMMVAGMAFLQVLLPILLVLIILTSYSHGKVAGLKERKTDALKEILENQAKKEPTEEE